MQPRILSLFSGYGGLDTRNEALKACGNGVMPQQAIAALRHMLAQQEVAA